MTFICNERPALLDKFINSIVQQSMVNFLICHCYCFISPKNRKLPLQYRKKGKTENDRAFERQSVFLKVIYFLHFLAQFSNFFHIMFLLPQSNVLHLKKKNERNKERKWRRKKSIIRKLISKSRGAQIYGLKVVLFFMGEFLSYSKCTLLVVFLFFIKIYIVF